MDTVTYAPIQERVAAGINLLDHSGIDWRSKVDLSTLRIDDTYLCVVGQVFDRNYTRGVDTLFPDENKEYCLLTARQIDQCRAHGFERTNNEYYSELTAEWIRQLSEN